MRPRILLASLALGLLTTLGSPPAHAHAEDTESPSVFVRILDADTELPVGAAEVIVNFLEGDPDHPLVTGTIYTSETNGGGHAFFRGLAPGGFFVVSVSARGYVSFGDGGTGDRPPTGLVTFGVGSGASGNSPANVVITLVPLCPDCP